MRGKYLLLPLVVLILALPGCRTITQPASFAPSGLTGHAVSSSEINLTWRDNSPDETGFYIYRKTTDNYSRVGVVLANTTSYNDKDLDPETTYSYKVTAYNDGGESESSNEITITTSGEEMPPSAPSDLVAIAVAYNQIDLSWQDNSDNEDGFYVYTKTSGDYYKVADLPANTTYFAHSGLEPLEKYTYYVQAYNQFGAADSNIAEATTLSGVEILDYSLGTMGCVDGKAFVAGHAQSNINEIISVMIEVWFYDSDGVYLDSASCQKYNIPPLATWEFDSWDSLKTLKSREVSYVTVEVTDVNID